MAVREPLELNDDDGLSVPAVFRNRLQKQKAFHTEGFLISIMLRLRLCKNANFYSNLTFIWLS
ncbi:conserved hypothetical protein [Alteromonas macleodii]|uniref:Uncharacterized protein n=1 Tax=Alteromonas macleodii TaxID=28108 RepID=A0AB36FRN2_ALTMA|nr:hypothetical protein ACZ81_15775 [Alteromonas macleodii]MAC09325.1 hypothetical protein [Alteromonas sp.]MAL70275.1 hypothetical protein [Alteromonas sp.]MBS08781.1 hypothetical protein [Alteromonas sp.]OES28567.1 hypothetical protein BFV93_3342 [Alteromonas macleodii]